MLLLLLPRRVGRLSMLPRIGQGDRLLPASGVPDCDWRDKGASCAVLGEDCGRKVPVRRPVDLRRVNAACLNHGLFDLPAIHRPALLATTSDRATHANCTAMPACEWHRLRVRGNIIGHARNNM